MEKVRLARERSGQEGLARMRPSSRHHCLSYVAPREEWLPLQRFRTLFLPDQRCGPHLHLLDPFVEGEAFPAAAALLAPLAASPAAPAPFALHARAANIYTERHARSHVLKVALESEPEGAFGALLEFARGAFPLCAAAQRQHGGGEGEGDVEGDVEGEGEGKGSGGGPIAGGGLRLLPSITLGRFSSEEELERALQEHIMPFWTDCTLTVREVYMLGRRGGDPFEIAQVIPLGPGPPNRTPRLGPGSVLTKSNSPYRKVIYVAGFPAGLGVKEIPRILASWRVRRFEVVKNGNGKYRPIAVVDFESEKSAENALSMFPCESLPNSYARPLALMTYPGIPFDCCSTTGVKFERRSRQNLEDLDRFVGLKLTGRFHVLGEGAGGSEVVMNPYPIETHSKDIRGVFNPSLNAATVGLGASLEGRLDEWDGFVLGWRFAPTGWAKEVEALHLRERGFARGPDRHETDEDCENRLLREGRESEPPAKRELGRLGWGKTPLTPLEMEELLRSQLEAGGWDLKAVAGSLHVPEQRLVDLLQSWGLRSLGKAVEGKAAELFATALVLGYLRFHFRAVPFSFQALERLPFAPLDQGMVEKFQQRMRRADAWMQAREKELPKLCETLGLGPTWDRATFGLHL